MTTALVSALLAVVLALGGTGVTLAAAQESNANDFLYPVKLFSEDARLWLSLNEETDLQLEMQFLERRTSELNYLLSNGEPVNDGYLFRLHNEVNSILQKALQSPPDEALQLMERVREQLMAQSQLMLQMNGGSDDALLQQSQTMLQQQTRFVENALESPVMNREQLQQQLQQQIATQEGIMNQAREQFMQQTQLQQIKERSPAGELVTPTQTGSGQESNGGGNGNGDTNGNGGNKP